MKQYDMMRSGDINAIAESTRLWDSGLYGYLSDDPLKNAKYRFVTTITLATRFAIEGGMDEEDAYNASDLLLASRTWKTKRPTCRLHTEHDDILHMGHGRHAEGGNTFQSRQRMPGLHPLPSA